MAYNTGNPITTRGVQLLSSPSNEGSYDPNPTAKHLQKSLVPESLYPVLHFKPEAPSMVSDSVELDGIDDRIEAQGTTDFDNTVPYSMAGWVKVISQSGSPQQIVSKAGTSRKFLLEVFSNNFRVFSSANGSTYEAGITNSLTISNGEWYFLAFRVNLGANGS